jgi:hypothetical protein
MSQISARFFEKMGKYICLEKEMKKKEEESCE